MSESPSGGLLAGSAKLLSGFLAGLARILPTGAVGVFIGSAGLSGWVGCAESAFSLFSLVYFCFDLWKWVRSE